MTVRYPDVTLLIQGFGLYRDTSRDVLGNVIANSGEERLDFMPFLGYYKTLFPKIILSTWEEDIDDNLRTYCVANDITLVSNKLDSINTQYNFGKQLVTTLNGLKEVKTKYTLKHRTDERYSNLDILIDLFLKDTNKFVSGGTIFAAKSHYPYHAGDHLYIAKTSTLRAMFEIMLHNLKYNKFETNNTGSEIAAEITITKTFLRVNGEEPSSEQHNDLMLKYFDVVNDDLMAPYLIRFNTIGKIYRNPEDRAPFWRDYKSIHDLLSINTMRI